MLLLIIAIQWFAYASTTIAKNVRSRASIKAYLSLPANADTRKEWETQFGTIDNLLDMWYPDPWTSTFIKYLFNINLFSGKLCLLTLILFLWPWMTIGALLVFRISMRRTKIRSAHVMRCVLYSFDAALWSALFFIVMMAANAAIKGNLDITTIGIPMERWLYNLIPALQNISVMLLVLIAILLYCSYRLIRAYRLYLRFHMPLATIVASQVIVLLFSFNLMLVIGYLIEW